MGPRVLSPAVIATVVAMAGCASGSPTAPTPVEILSQQYRLICSDWSPATAPVTRTLVDVKVKGSGEKVTESELAVLRQQGGDVIHEYAAGRLVRVAIDVDLAAAQALGGTIRNIYTHALVGYSLQIEDAMIPRLRALPGVVKASLSGYGCLI